MRAYLQALSHDLFRFILGFLGVALLLRFIPMVVRHLFRTLIMNVVLLLVGALTFGLFWKGSKKY